MGIFRKNRVALALGSGGPRGLAHIGVIKALEEMRIGIDAIAGTSVGAMIGGFYAAGIGSAKIEEIFRDITLSELATMFSDVTLKSGIIKGERLERFLDKYLANLTIESLPCKYAAVATKITTAEEAILTTGSLTKAIRASSSLPGFLDIFYSDQGYLLDGGVSQPIPVRAARTLSNVSILAVNLDTYYYSASEYTEKPGLTTIGKSALKLLRHSLSQELCREATLALSPDVAKYAWINLTNKQDRIDIIEAGYRSVMEHRAEIESIA